ncbi:MAG TPA: aromatic ring-hydroxylating dioxygenase subunit alpha [Steroidobacteraceae bacterium]|nr:aromatic ring-hydroxylating dioxygenase subunit alpha [Steroidobacteraceae bacterium]
MPTVDDFSLPSWAYSDPEFFALERERVFRPSWQVICHVSEIPNPGDYQVFDFIGEMLFAMRGNDGQVRVFHNVCRHRASRLLDGPRGHCNRRIICPYHAWSYDLEGKLASPGDRSAFPHLDISRESLVPVEMEIYAGFVFARVQGGGPSVAEMLQPYAGEIATHEFEKLEPIGRVTLRPRTVNWKNVGDNYSDALHIPVAHPGLTRLFGASYRVESSEWVDRMSGEITDKPSRNWPERMYQKYLPDAPQLAADKRRSWVYFKLWPNFAFDVYPDQVDIMQWLPVSPTECLIREIGYARPDDRREMRVARYCNWRINRQVNAEDTVLIQRVQDGMASGSYRVGPLAAGEVALRSFGRRMRALIPECAGSPPPAAGWSRNPAARA